MRRRIIAVGERVGRLVVVEPRLHAESRLRCLCDCGNQCSVPYSTWGRTRSCGCIVKETRKNTPSPGSRTHGMCGTPEYRTWRTMLDRTTNPAATNYQYYGGRGITVCERWREFAAFYADMGVRPAGHTLDRRDPDGNYEPGNCRWATYAEQARNRRRAAGKSGQG